MGSNGLRPSATAASTSVVLGKMHRGVGSWKVPTAFTGLLAPSTCRASIAALSSSLERVTKTGRPAQKVSAKSYFVWLWLMLGATDRIGEQTTRQAGPEIPHHVGRAEQSAQSAAKGVDYLLTRSFAHTPYTHTYRERERRTPTHTPACRRHRRGMAIVVAGCSATPCCDCRYWHRGRHCYVRLGWSQPDRR